MKLKHTPGPWFVEVASHHQHCYDVRSKVENAVLLGGAYNRRDAVLAAAAPELARILGKILDTDANAGDFADLCIEAREILAKARGES